MQIPRPGRFEEPSKASVALCEWLDSTGQKQADLMRALAISRQYASFLVGGQRVPSLELAQAIEVLTDGAVMVMDWRVPAGSGTAAGVSSSGGQEARPSARTGEIRLAARQDLAHLQRRVATKTRRIARGLQPASRCDTSPSPSTPSTSRTRAKRH